MNEQIKNEIRDTVQKYQRGQMKFEEFQERLESLILRLSVSRKQDETLRRIANELEVIRFTALVEDRLRKVEQVASTLFSVLDELS